MRPSGIRGHVTGGGWCVARVVFVVCLAMNIIGGAVGQKNEGDACQTSRGRRGICRELYDCLSLASQLTRQDTCGFRGKTPIVCCQEQVSGREALGPERTARQTEAPWWMQNGRPFSTTQASNNWWRPEVEDTDDADEDFEPSSTRRPTTRRPTTRRTTRRSTTRRPRPPVTNPSTLGGVISAAKCREYSKPVQPIVEALPLLPSSETIKVPVEKCKFNRLELIVGGTNASVGEFPHMAALGYQTGNGIDGIEWLCGGSLISENFVLTAAHCAFAKRGKLTTVRLGELNLASDFDGASPLNYRVGEIIRHPEHQYGVHYNDIALLKLVERVQFNDNIRPACLYTRDAFDVNKAIATGWGQVGFTESVSDNMLKVAIDIVDSPTCFRLYQDLMTSSTKLNQGIVPSMLCAGDLRGGKDTCLGDSGGPLQISNKKNQCIHYVIGITSFGKFCGAKNAAGVYTRVSAYIPWIESVVWPSE